MPRTSNELNAFRTAMIWLISLSMLHSQMVWAMADSKGSASAVETVSNVDELFDQLSPVSSALDASQLDADEAVFSLNFDADEIVDFVRADIHFQAYPGLLRSARGTLISRSGNALDQSVLLAKLLKDAGQEARIVRGTLDSEDAERLVMQMRGPSSWPSPFADGQVQGVESWLRDKSLAPPDDQAFRADVDRILGDSMAAYETIRDEVERLAVLASTGSMIEGLVEEARTYYWVEHRLGPGEPWVGVHPAFADAHSPSPEVAGYMADTIPEHLQHRVRIEVKAQTRLGGAVQVSDLMTPWERPAANAAYLPQTLAVLPYNGKTADSNTYLETAASQAELFVLTWNDSLAPGAQVFTLEGDVLPMDAFSAAGGVIKQVSDRVSAATDALGGLGLSEVEEAERAPAKRLERLWIEYSIIAPGGQTRNMKRHILDLTDGGTLLVHQQEVGEQAWAREARAALLQSRSLLIATGPVNPAWLTRAFIDSAEDGKATLRSLEQRASAPEAEIGPQILNGLEPLPDTRWIKYLFATHTSTGFTDRGVAYLHQPALISFNHGVRAGGDRLMAYEQIDLLFNARRVLERKENGLVPSPAAAALAGVLQTQAEHRQLQSRGADRQDSAFQRLSGSSAEIRRFMPGDLASLASAGLGPGALRAAERELTAGYALLVPETDDAASWWRVDLETGTTTGMAVTSGGYGGAKAAEYIATLGLVAGTLLMYMGFYNCFTGGDSGLALFCCLVDSWLTGIIVAMLAFVAAHLTAAGLMFLEGTTPATVGPMTETFIAILNFILYDGGSAAISFTDFRIAVCGTLTGT